MLSLYESLVHSKGSLQEKEDCLEITFVGFPEKATVEGLLKAFEAQVYAGKPKQWWVFDFSGLSLLDWASFELLGKTLNSLASAKPPVNGMVFIVPENPFVRVWLEEELKEIEDIVLTAYFDSCKEARLFMNQVL
ncbi:MAG: hypothetical protein KatS3mg033_1077 [Thermonema sp.]|uniref:hypothetical protein n=1 Tax=Thermonema sp. TaxID=2231181 RepID=UPI0021DC2F06|nr:hypothetical protein [Thermonema sp.]GIV39277.1 MAG: hypothetical protein KatS3mg033_1077 [Thermonema sp.]